MAKHCWITAQFNTEALTLRPDSRPEASAQPFQQSNHFTPLFDLMCGAASLPKATRLSKFDNPYVFIKVYNILGL